jgi:hypothetical protein
MQPDEAVYSPPEVQIGTQVYWYRDPLTLDSPNIGWICRRPGAQTVSIMVFSPDGGFVEKQSVRHRFDPGLRENSAWRQWGCWDYSPLEKNIARVLEVASQLAIQHERAAKKSLPDKP